MVIDVELLNIQVPFFFKNIIDQLNVDFSVVTASGVQATVLTVAGTAIIGCRLLFLSYC